MIEELLAEEMASAVARTHMEEVLNLRCQQLEQKTMIPSEEKGMDINSKQQTFLFVTGDVKALAAYNFDSTLKDNNLIVDKANVPNEPVSTIATKKTDLINDGIGNTVVMKAGAAESSAEKNLAMLYETGCHQEIKQRKNKKQKRRRRQKQ